jgi:hypothetical protein
MIRQLNDPTSGAEFEANLTIDPFKRQIPSLDRNGGISRGCGRTAICLPRAHLGCKAALRGGRRPCYAGGMSGIFTIKTILLGVVSWLVPFAISFMFFDRTGQLVIPQPLFKSMMVVVGGGVGVALLVAAFRRIRASVRSGLALGCCWLAINLALDLAVLVPLAKMSVSSYLYDIGLRYLMIPIISTAIGIVVSRQISSEPPA